MASVDSPHNKLQELIRSKQWNKALEVAYQMLESQPESSWLHTTLGKIYYHLHEYKHAETSLKTAIYHHNNLAEAHAYLGLTYLKLHRVGTADDHCKQALSLDSSDIHAWTLNFRTKLAYSDIPAAKECLTTLKNLGADEPLLSTLTFYLIRHPASKTPVDSQAEISERKALLLSHPTHFSIHAELAYLYTKFTNRADLAEMHIDSASQHRPLDPLVQETSILIQRKKNILLRIITAPAQSLTRPHLLHKNEVAIVGFTLIALITFTCIGSKHPWMVRTGVFSIITLFFCSFTANTAFQYLTLTELYHKSGKTELFKEPFRNIHCLPFQQRCRITALLTILSWALLAISFFLLTR